MAELPSIDASTADVKHFQIPLEKDTSRRVDMVDLYFAQIQKHDD